MRRRPIALALTGLLVAGACTGGDDAATTTPAAEPGDASTDATTDETTGEQALGEPVDDDLASSAWLIGEVAFETNDIWRGADADGALEFWRLLPGDPTIAMGVAADAQIVFASDDDTTFRPIHRGCCGPGFIARDADRIVLTALGASSATAHLSVDGGSTWTEQPVALPIGTSELAGVPAEIHPVDGGYLVAAAPLVDAGGPPAAVWRSDDLETWTAVELPGFGPTLPANSFVEVGRGGSGELWATVSISDGTKIRSVVPYRSADGGRTFEGLATLVVDGIIDIAPVADRLVIWPANAYADAHPWVLVPDAGWVRSPDDDAQWGDAHLRVITTSTDRVGGRIAMVVERSVIAPGWCLDRFASCTLDEHALVTSDDGVVWRDVVVPDWNPGESLGGTRFPALAAGADDRWVLWQPTEADGAVAALTWTGPAALPGSDPLRVYVDGPIGVGELVRYVLDYDPQRCAGQPVAGTNWAIEPDLPENPPADWPAQLLELDVDGADGVVGDGPVAFDGTLERVAPDRMMFWMDGVDQEFVLTPADPNACG